MDAAPVAVRSRIFDGLSDAERQAWLRAAGVRNLRRSEVLTRQGEPAQHLYLLETGFVKIVQSTDKGHDVIVRLVGPGEPVAGVTALDVDTYPVTAISLEATRV